MGEFDDQLSRAAGEPIEDLDFSSLAERAATRGRRRRTIRVTTVVATALIVVIAVAATIATGGSDTDLARSPTSTSSIGKPGEWVKLPQAPIDPSRFPFAVWTGSKLVVFSTTDTQCDQLEPTSCRPSTNPDQVLATGGAAYDPATNRWDRIAAPPIGFTRTQVQEIDGQLYALGRSNRSDTNVVLLRYDPDADRWSRLDNVETPRFGIWKRTAVIGHDLVVYDPGWGPTTLPDASYDTTGGAWNDLPPDPLTSDPDVHSGRRQLISFGSRLYRFAGVMVSPTPGVIQPDLTTHPVERIAVLDDDGWRALPTGPPDRDRFGTGTWWVTGDHLTMLDPLVMPRGRPRPMSGAAMLTFDPTTNRLATATPPPQPSGRQPGALSVASNGNTLAAMSPTWGAVLDPAAGTWHSISAPGKPRLHGFVTAWAGDQLVFWGGHVDAMNAKTAEVASDGWIWTPPTTQSPGASTIGS